MSEKLIIIALLDIATPESFGTRLSNVDDYARQLGYSLCVVTRVHEGGPIAAVTYTTLDASAHRALAKYLDETGATYVARRAPQ